MSKTFYLTTAIDYVNGHPHLGHAYEKVITDAICRVQQSFGRDTFFLTGLDEHGQKVQKAAVEQGKQPQAYCDELAESWQRFADVLGLCNQDFVRTTQERHQNVVRSILNKLHLEDHFYKANYEGYYSAKQETFLTEKDRQEDGNFPEIYGEVVRLSEDNYYFKLGRHQQWLIDFIESNPDFVTPSNRRNEVLGFLKNNTLEDLCISRPKSRLNWGIPLPFDDDYVTYVWFDALTNYITVPASLGDPALPGIGSESQESMSLWPADMHVIGKDILKFHAVYWPIMLKAAGLPLPKQICVHGWWQKDGQKMSKTTGNVVDPMAVIESWGLDAFRYYLLRELDIGPDGNWTDEGFQVRYAADLANGIGNLVNRSLSMLNRYRDGKIPPRCCELESEVHAVSQEVIELAANHKLQSALKRIWDLIARINRYIDQTAPFKLAKDPEQAERLGEILYTLAESCRIIAVLLHPFLPHTSSRIYGQLALNDRPDRFSNALWGELNPGHTIDKPEALFPRRDLPAQA
ncbi:methionine--tRNA ligase [Verrucomicrobia bacterium]|nr:methionine--tRNA ligase [Verrucomicrobiota bacterium]MDG1890361.1 methionine--tRNA ligase [Verrucomicrobiota bacterium]